ncbi:ABC transporter permease [Bacillus massiliigorillae]|uniref:ABC transporter permease n=1 Tax=Bacillus massiliigorillae TaxID=1243664 RepID=UPI00039A8F3B|nr:ABC transporter permease [Bacillus massiliigorillae]
MTFSMKRVQAIFTKDYKDLMKNYYVLFNPLFPLLIALWVGKTGNTTSTQMGFLFNFALVMTAIYVQAAIVAEEKEKNTLRGLLLSPASTTEIMLGKSLLTTFVTFITLIASIFLSGYKITNLLWFTIAILLCLITYIALGTILGLLSRSVMESSLVGIPFMFIFCASSLIMPMIDNEILKKIIASLPNSHLEAALDSLNGNTSLSSISEHIINLLIWGIVCIAITLVIYKKRRFD